RGAADAVTRAFIWLFVILGAVVGRAAAFLADVARGRGPVAGPRSGWDGPHLPGLLGCVTVLAVAGETRGGGHVAHGAVDVTAWDRRHALGPWIRPLGR